MDSKFWSCILQSLTWILDVLCSATSSLIKKNAISLILPHGAKHLEKYDVQQCNPFLSLRMTGEMYVNSYQNVQAVFSQSKMFSPSHLSFQSVSTLILIERDPNEFERTVVRAGGALHLCLWAEEKLSGLYDHWSLTAWCTATWIRSPTPQEIKGKKLFPYCLSFQTWHFQNEGTAQYWKDIKQYSDMCLWRRPLELWHSTKQRNWFFHPRPNIEPQ